MSSVIKGRGAQILLGNKFSQLNYHPEDGFLPCQDESKIRTKVYTESPNSIISKNDSPDIPFSFSINPYQGCEHGCVYCYARNSHEYWGFNASLDFESKIIRKPNAPELLRKNFLKKHWIPETIVMSGNTDCYQPIEKKYKITRDLLKIFLEFGNPVGIITKNILVLRDTDLLKELARENLVHVIFSITSLDEGLRQKLEHRSSASIKKFVAIRTLKDHGIPVSVMMSPVIPGLNDHEIPAIIRESASSGAEDIHISLIRLNGVIGQIFNNWLHTHFPQKKEKILNQIRSLHGGKLNESRFGFRMKGEGPLATSIHHLFKMVKSHYFHKNDTIRLDVNRFRKYGMKKLF